MVKRPRRVSQRRCSASLYGVIIPFVVKSLRTSERVGGAYYCIIPFRAHFCPRRRRSCRPQHPRQNLPRRPPTPVNNTKHKNKKRTYTLDIRHKHIKLFTRRTRADYDTGCSSACSVPPLDVAKATLFSGRYFWVLKGLQRVIYISRNSDGLVALCGS